MSLPQSAMESRAGVFNGRCFLRQEGEQWVIVVSGVAAYRYRYEDEVGKAYAMVYLVESGYATQEEVSRVYGCSVRTIRRHQRRYEERGMEGLSTRSGWRSGRRRLSVKRRLRIERMHAEGLSNREIARRLGVSEKAIRKQVGPSSEMGEQIPLPLGTDREDWNEREESNCEETERKPSETVNEKAPPKERAQDWESIDWDPRNRLFDRTLARYGKLDDAAPMFADAEGVIGAGVLFALPFLVQSGVFRIAAKLYGDIGPAFYGLRTTFTVLLFMALWRIKRPEGLKERDPASLGLILGLDRAPEVKTVRRKLTSLAALHKAEQIGKELARIRVEQRSAMMGFLYVDGHVRAYHGKRNIPKGHVARMRIAMPAVSDYWVGDAAGDPLFVVTAEANTGLAKMLPSILKEIQDLVQKRRVTIVFDRGGWKLELFKQIINDFKFDIITYKKGKSQKIDPNLFSNHAAVIDGRAVAYELHDQMVTFLDGKLELRQVTRLNSDDHQTQIVTSRFDLKAVEVAFRMFERWRQENYFRYMREEFALDALSDYRIEPGDPTRTVPNPERKQIAKRIKSVRQEIKSLEQTLGGAVINAKDKNLPGVPALAASYSEVESKLTDAREELAGLLKERKGTPLRVEIREISEGAVIKLATERKHLTNVIKMLAYQSESDLLTLLAGVYRRNENEGRTLIHELFAAPADLHVENNELCITLHPLSSPHRTDAVRKICQTLTDTNTRFPGSNLCIRFNIKSPPLIGLAFPGPNPR
ncbi:MAG: helix-turn-helix domain-containing protein [Deltaproteobacteria bacterium]|nr:helix-turn-helix domain-containing protein [Deltaproteobacteria bacterium]